MNERRNRERIPRWSERYFAEEESALSAKRPLPPGAPRLKAGDRVSFDLGEGIDGPPYAMNVRPIDDED